MLLPANALGKFKFVLQVDAPDPAKIPDADVAGVTIVLLTCSYKDKDFVRVGYYVSNEYTDPLLAEEPPAKPQIDKLERKIAAHEPRVTKFPHDFDFVKPDLPPVVEVDEEEIEPNGLHAEVPENPPAAGAT